MRESIVSVPELIYGNRLIYVFLFLQYLLTIEMRGFIGRKIPKQNRADQLLMELFL